MKTPDFWYTPSTNGRLKSVLLRPLSWVYWAGRQAHKAVQQPKSVDIPVICIGNATAGGSGKTPTVIAIFKHIKAHKTFKKPVFLTRGYKGNLQGPLRVDPKIHAPSHVGEEALELAAHAPVIVSANRFDGALYARQLGFDAVLMDDGYQNRHIKPDVKLLVIDGSMGFGNNHLLPAGPLRESQAEAFQEAKSIIFIGEDTHNILPRIPANLPVFEAEITPTKKLTKKQLGYEYLAFAGIGYPDKFFKTCRNLKLNILDTKTFQDHHAYSLHDINTLIEDASAKGLKLVTTEKDAVKIRHLNPDAAKDILVIAIDLVFKNDGFVSKTLTEALEAAA